MNFLLGVIDPIAISIGPIDVRWYGVIIATGIVLAFLVAQREMVKRGFHPEFLTDLLIWAVPIAILGARLYYVFSKWSYYSENPGQILQIWEGGLAIHGALIASFITAYVFTKKRNVSFLKLADVVAPSLLIGQTIGRWGNFMNQEAHGGPVSRAFLENMYLPDWIINQMKKGDTYYHPTFLYESVWNFIGLVIMILLRRVNLLRGEMLMFYIIWYSSGRYFIEGMRTDSLYLFGEFRTAQVVSIVAVVVAIIIIVYRRMKAKDSARYKDA